MTRWSLVLMPLLVMLDQASKWWAQSALPFQELYPLVPHFSLYLTHNFGISFSLFSGAGPWPLVGLTLVITLFMSYLWWKVPPGQSLASLGFALVVGGAIGNLIDRTLFGYVIDYFLFHTDNWSFAVFNVADSFITVGAIAIVLNEIISWRRGEAEPSN